MALGLAALVISSGSGGAAEPVRGLPFTRSYALEEIGNVPRGARLSFDAFGRLAVINYGVYTVLNDTVWIDMADRTAHGGVIITNVIRGPDGQSYYGARGSWGRAELGRNGRLNPVSLVPLAHPEWTDTSSFADMIATDHGVYFAGWNGVVFWDTERQVNRLFEFASVSSIFRVGNRVFVSSHSQPLHEIDVARGVLRVVPGTEFGGFAVDFATDLDDTRALISVRDGRLLVFDGEAASEWPWQQRNNLTGSVSAMQHLVDGGTAVAITGKGLFLVSPEGELITSLTAPQYHRITGLASREPGLLWVAAEDTIEKVLYGSPLTVFGQRLGLPVHWPIVMRWDGRIVVASRGRLYEAVSGAPGEPSRFELMRAQPAAGAWAAAMSGGRMLIGNATGVFAVETDGRFTPLPCNIDVLHLVATGDDLCFVIGRTETAVVRWTDGQWSECAPRIAGIGYPTVVLHSAPRSAWIELGANSVARLSLQEGRLKLQTFQHLLANQIQWVNVGIVDDTVVLSGASGDRVFFDEKSGSFVEAPELARLLERSPHWIIRVVKDGTGTLWAAHEEGVVTFTPKDRDYEIDASTFDFINDRYPAVRVLPGDDIWFWAGRSLHHVDRRRIMEPKHPREPLLVSVVDTRTNTELFDRGDSTTAPLRLPYEQNSLGFRFFSGGYTWRRVPVYEFRLSGSDRWATLGSSSLLSFSGLQEGRYRLEVRRAGAHDPAVRPATFDFEIRAPWHRTWPAYASYLVGLGFAVLGIARWSSQHARHRNLALEKLVRERTSQLKLAMEKLNEEARNAATLAERDRLAGEIHDSLQQGLSGLMLQLDATLKLPSVTGDVRSRLSVARNMVSFTRQEVQHAVWDLESPLLQEGELGEALRKLTALINSGATRIEIAVSGPPLPLPSMTKHHLLRIAQEAITNAVRHAAAQRIAIELEYQADALALAVHDDGIGFHPEHVLTGGIGHFGLRGLRSRASKIGGDLRVQSSPGEGTLVRVIVPLASPVAPPINATAEPA